MEGEAIIGVLLMGALVIGVFVVMLNQQQKLDDPNNTEVVYLDQLTQVCSLAEPGNFRVRIFRQSGNLQKDDQFFTSVGDAIKAATSTFKRAKIDHVVITTNEETNFSFRRPYHDHRGVKEGKKVGKVEIRRMS
ncbi:hypothetical protein ACJO5Y_00400 [Marinobacter sp. GN3S48]|uniref:hypothetical protein n=1 Tax=Marinobacter sp. GN3S48 TaxID=3382302 RepID=UPI00387B29F0